MTKYKYILEPYKTPASRHTCPRCGNRKVFSRYVNLETMVFVADYVGRCNRETNCGYHYTPKEYFHDNNITTSIYGSNVQINLRTIIPQQKKSSFIPVQKFKDSLNNYNQNNFVAYLTKLLGAKRISELISMYFIGSSNHWLGAVVFWQIDLGGKIRTGKIMQYDPQTGKRIKEPYNHIAWAHKEVEEQPYGLKQCLFGEHLLKDKTRTVAIVESEKTAIISAAYFPQLIWCATGSLTNLNYENCKVLAGRKVILFPDLNGFKKWTQKALELSLHFPGTQFHVSDLLEINANNMEKKLGWDLADYLLHFNFRKINLKNNHVEKTQQLNDFTEVQESIASPSNRKIKSESWIQEVTELESFFKSLPISSTQLKIYPSSLITNVPKFLDSHFSTVKANDGNKTFIPYLERLRDLKNYLLQN